MNERMRELVLKAQTQAAKETIQNSFSYEGKVFEKFAELIVQECMGIISNESEKISDEWRCKDGKHIWWKIKEHFGVEE